MTLRPMATRQVLRSLHPTHSVAALGPQVALGRVATLYHRSSTLNHGDSRTHSVPLFLKRPCDRTLTKIVQGWPKLWPTLGL
jgi:hypothetical protein